MNIDEVSRLAILWKQLAGHGPTWLHGESDS